MPKVRQTINGDRALMALVENYLGSASNGTEASIRFRPPYLQTSRHDARGDAVALVVEHLLQRLVFYFFKICSR